MIKQYLSQFGEFLLATLVLFLILAGTLSITAIVNIISGVLYIIVGIIIAAPLLFLVWVLNWLINGG